MPLFDLEEAEDDEDVEEADNEEAVPVLPKELELLSPGWGAILG